MISYLQIENISKAWGDTVLFSDITFQLSRDSKIALIAPNGTGKSTLFNIISGKDSPDTGAIRFHKDISIGFLEQEPALDEKMTLLEQILSRSGEVSETIKEYELAIELNDNKRIEKAVEMMDFHQAWDHENKVKEILTRLNLHDYEKKVKTLSGGERKRVALATVLLQQPDLLILDEPTNHLDLEMIEWLEEYLKNNISTFLIVTHDRYFLDRVCNEIIELDHGQLFHYVGNYPRYLEKRAERIENEQAGIDKARNLMRKELDWMRRQPQARATKAKYRIDAFYELQEKALQTRQDKTVDINVKGARLGTKIIEVHNLSKQYGDKKLLTDFSYIFNRSEKIGIIGKNGAGKTTFLNLITEKIPADKGTVVIGETLKIGYYTQAGIKFNEQEKVIDVVREIAEVVTLGNGDTVPITHMLTKFLFPPAVQHSFVYKLSGGERRRLYLLTILIQNPNFLILDEPTNDLDIATLNILEDYLISFSGCVLIVSHDRFFMDKVVDHLFVFQENGVIKDFPGNYSDYRDYVIQKEKENQSTERKMKPVVEQIVLPKNENEKKLSYKEKLEFEKLSSEIQKLEMEKVEIETLLSKSGLNTEEIIPKTERLAKVLKEIENKSDRWLELSDRA